MFFTSKVKGIIFSIVLIVIAMILVPITIDSVHTVTTDPTTQAFAGTVVGGGSANVVLTEDLYLADTDFVTAITATGAGAVPVADSYVSATNTLTITGLGVDTPQDITVTHDYEVNDEYNGVNALTMLIPLMMVVGIVIVAIINGLWSIRKD